MTDWKAVGTRIRELREMRGLTQSQLGEVVLTSANYVTKVEGGLGISDTKLDAYAKALGVSVPFLRYGVNGSAEDIAFVREIGRREGREETLRELQVWLAQFVEGHSLPLPTPVVGHSPEKRSAAHKPTADTREITPEGGTIVGRLRTVRTEPHGKKPRK